MSGENKQITRKDVTKYLVLCIVLMVAGIVFIALLSAAPVFSTPLFLFSMIGIAFGALGIVMYFSSPETLYNLFHSKKKQIKS